MADPKSQPAAERGPGRAERHEANAEATEAQAVVLEARREEAEAYMLIQETAAWSGQFVPPVPMPPQSAPIRVTTQAEISAVVASMQGQIDGVNDTLKGLSSVLEQIKDAAGRGAGEPAGDAEPAGSKPRR